MTREATFWSKVNKTESCWLWTGTTYRNGYGKYGGRLAHRVSWKLAGRPVPVVGMQMDHLCRVRACVNPDHLEPVTAAVNVLRSAPATKKACRNGHPFDEDNTYHRPSAGEGRRNCRRCNAEAARRYQARKAV